MKKFLIGMSGIGMQGLAYVLKQNGNEVVGWDDGIKIAALENEGIFYTKDLTSVDVVIYSSAIQENHELMLAACEKGIPCINRTDYLVNHVRFNPDKILIAGAHGKTTTTGMLAYLLGMKSYLVGGIILGQKFAGNNEQDRFTIIEMDESDGSFLKWKGSCKIILNFDFEHMDYYKTEESIIAAYRKFVMDDIETTHVIMHSSVQQILQVQHRNIVTYNAADANISSSYTYSNLQFLPDGLQFNISGSPIKIPVFGEHNASNFTAIYATCQYFGIDLAAKIIEFPGMKKRMQLVKTEGKFRLFSDYGHHPVEVAATLRAFVQHTGAIIHVILEPHRYSRLSYTWSLWPEALRGFKVFVLPLHTAGETPIEGIDSVNFVRFLQEQGVDAQYLEKFEDYKLTADTIGFSAGKFSTELENIS